MSLPKILRDFRETPPSPCRNLYLFFAWRRNGKRATLPKVADSRRSYVQAPLFPCMRNFGPHCLSALLCTNGLLGCKYMSTTVSRHCERIPHYNSTASRSCQQSECYNRPKVFSLANRYMKNKRCIWRGMVLQWKRKKKS